MKTGKLKNKIITDRASLDEADKDFIADVFLTKVFPVLSPLAIDPAHPFPFIPNTGYSLALQLERQSDKRELQALLPIPGIHSRGYLRRLPLTLEAY